MFGVIRSAALAMAVAAVAVSAAPGAADAQMANKAVDARQALMKDNGKSMKVVADFVKNGMGTAADVAMSARMIASDLAQFPNHFPKGTEQGGSAGDTRAKAEIWASWPKFVEGAAMGARLALDLSAAAETGDKAAIGAAMGELGKGCGGCHQAWRGPKN